MKRTIKRKKWQKVIDGMPEIDDDYIVWGKKIGMHAAIFVKERGFLDYASYTEINDITHWHALPSEPKHKDR